MRVVDAAVIGSFRFLPITEMGFHFRVTSAFFLRSIFDRDRDTIALTDAMTVTIVAARRIMAIKKTALNKMNSFILIPPSCSVGWSIDFDLQVIPDTVSGHYIALPVMADDIEMYFHNLVRQRICQESSGMNGMVLTI